MFSQAVSFISVTFQDCIIKRKKKVFFIANTQDITQNGEYINGIFASAFETNFHDKFSLRNENNQIFTRFHFNPKSTKCDSMAIYGHCRSKIRLHLLCSLIFDLKFPKRRFCFLVASTNIF